MRKKLMKIGLVASTFVPLSATLACSSLSKYIRGADYDISYIAEDFPNDKNQHKNVLSTFYNSTDMMAALGYYPDYAALMGEQIYSDYLKDALGENNLAKNNSSTITTGKYQIGVSPKIMDGEIVNTESLVKQDISTVILNEWMINDESNFVGITPAILYTSMADEHARYQDEDFYEGSNVNSNINAWGLNTFEAFLMLAKGMDRAYPGHNLTEKAQDLINQVQANIELLNKANPFKNESIIVLEVKQNDKGELEIDGARSPGVYSILYSGQSNRGLNFSFPNVQNPGNLKVDQFKITALDEVSFIEEFRNSSDHVIVLNDQHNPYFDLVSSQGREKVSPILKAGLNPEENIHILERDYYYDSVWGIYGLNQFLGNFAKSFKIDVNLNPILAFQELESDKKLEKLR